MKSRTLITFCVVIACLLSAAAAPATAAMLEVPALVNVQKGVTPAPTDAEIEAIIKETNKLLKQAGIKLMFDKNKSINRDFATPGHANGTDNKIDADEDAKLDPAGVKELEKHTGEAGKGTKIVITDLIHGDASTLGLAAHDPDSPVIYLKNGQSAAKGGNTVAHEFGHVFTLGSNHVVDDKDTPANPGDDEKADGDGHSDKPGNLMHATENGTILTQDQIDELKKGAKGHGKSTTWLGRAWRWVKKTFGSPTVAPTLIASGLQAGPNIPDPAGTLSVNASFGGGMGPGESVSIAMGVNTDGNPLSGRSLQRPDGTFMEGVDRTLLINITGNPEAGGTVDAALLDEGGSLIKPMAVEFEQILKFVDNDPTTDDTYRVYDKVSVEFDPADLVDLNVSTPECLVEFFSYENPLGAPVDGSEALVIDLLTPPEAGPELDLITYDAEPGEDILFNGFDFFPNATDILIQFDDDEVAMVPGANLGGMFNGEFRVPDVENGWYFITASTTDPLGGEEMQYAFKMLKVTPEPGTLILLAAGSTAVLRRRRRRCAR